MTPEDALTVRLNDLYRRVENTEKDKASRRDVDALSEDVRELKDEVKSLRRAIVGFCFTIAGSAVVFALAVGQLTGSP
jgi:hypothetical protein